MHADVMLTNSLVRRLLRARTCGIWVRGWSWGWSGMHDRPRRWELSLVFYLLLAWEEAAHISACVRLSVQNVSAAVHRRGRGVRRVHRAMLTGPNS